MPRELTPQRLRAARSVYLTRGPDLAYIASLLDLDLEQLRRCESALVSAPSSLPQCAAARRREVARAFRAAKRSKVPVPLALISEHFGVSMQQLKAVHADLTAGAQREVTALKHHMPFELVQGIARALRIRPPEDQSRTGRPKSERSGTMLISDILALLDRGLPYEEIGEAAGITRQRVLQLAQRAGKPSRSEERSARRRAAAAAKAEQIKRRSAERLKALADRFRSANAMFIAGEDVAVIARTVGCSVPMMNQYIHRCRRRLGPGWFPYRQPPRTSRSR